MFCVYLTSYRGNKLPPFYIGSSSIKKVTDGYHGSVKSKKYVEAWSHEIKHNNHLFRTTIISTHATRGEATKREQTLHKQLNVVRSSMYINMSVASRNGYFGRDVSGENNPNFGKAHSPNTRKKMSEKAKGKTISTQTKIKNRQITLLWWQHHQGERDIRRAAMSGENNPQYGKTGVNSPAYGRSHTPAAKERIKEALLGQRHTEEHVKQTCISYRVQVEETLEVFEGYGLSAFSRKIGLSPSSFLYTLTSNKFRNGFRITGNLGRPTSEHLPLTLSISN